MHVTLCQKKLSNDTARDFTISSIHIYWKKKYKQTQLYVNRFRFIHKIEKKNYKKF